METPQSLEIGEFEVILKDVVLPMGLVVNALTLTGADLKLEKDPFKIDSPTPGKIEVLILEDNLAAFLTKRAPGGLRDFSIQLKEGKIFVQASMKMILEVRASATCRLRIQDGAALYVDLESVDLMGVGAKNLVQGQLDKINPVLETKDFPVQTTLTNYEIADGRLTLYGDIYPRLVKS